VAETTKLKQQDGNDLVIYGHGLLGQTLLEGYLLDELKLGSTPCWWAAARCSFGKAERHD
jgi:hypothetical protein